VRRSCSKPAAAGEIRPDPDAFELMRGVGNLCIGAEQPPRHPGRYDARRRSARRRTPVVAIAPHRRPAGNEPVNGSLSLLDMTPYGRGEAWEDNPEGRSVIGDVRGGHPSGGQQACWYWRSDADGIANWGPTSRPVPQWTRPGATPVETLGRRGHHH
jgi:hypothetical protein